MSRLTEKPRSSEQLVEKPKIWWSVIVAVPVLIATGLLLTAKTHQMNTPEPVSSPVAVSVSALGTLEPQGEVIKVSAPTLAVQGASRVQQVLAKDGEWVKQGQVIAILDDFSSNRAAVEEAKANLQQARANFVQVKVGSPRDIQAQTAVIARLQAQLNGERDAQQATITSLQAQLSSEILAQRATVNRLKDELRGQRDTLTATLARVQAQARNASVDQQRYDSLYKEGAISQQERDSRRLNAETSSQQVTESQATRRQTVASLQQQLAQARAEQGKTITTLQQQLIQARANRNESLTTLEKQIEEEKTKYQKIVEVNPTNLQVAQAQVSNAIAALTKAESALTLSYVKAPITGQILKIHTKAGETVGSDGIAEIGRTDKMIVVAEVPEDSIGKVRLGQKATISSDNGAFSGQLQGTVTDIGRQIGKRNILDTDPGADVDARVVEVKIALSPHDSQQVSALTNAKVVAEIRI